MTHLSLFTIGLSLFTLVLAVIMANKDAATFASNVSIIHVREWMERAVCVLFASTMLCLSLPRLEVVPAMIVTVAMAPLFSLAFRPILNAFRKKPYWYMGPDLFWRGKRDSALDTAYHLAAWNISGRRFGPGGVLQKYPDRLPFILATAVEVILMGLLILAAVNFSTRHLPLL